MLKSAEYDILIDIVHNLNNIRLNKVVESDSFFAFFSEHTKLKRVYALTKLKEELYNDKFRDKDIQDIFYLSDYIFRNYNFYENMTTHNVGLVSLTRQAEINEQGLLNSLTFRGFGVDVGGLIVELLQNRATLAYNEGSYHINIISNEDIELLEDKDVIKYFCDDENTQIRIIGSEEELDFLEDLYDKIKQQLFVTSRKIFLFRGIKHIISLIPSSMRSLKIQNIFLNSEIIDKLLDKKIVTLNNLRKLDYFNEDLVVLENILDTLYEQNYIEPSQVQKELLETIKEKEAEYVKLRFEKGLSYKEIGEFYGISRAGTQSYFAKVLRKLASPARNKFFRLLIQQLLIFRNNDLFITKEIIDEKGVWIDLIREFYPNYFVQYKKDENIYVIDRKLISRLSDKTDDEVIINDDIDGLEDIEDDIEDNLNINLEEQNRAVISVNDENSYFNIEEGEFGFITNLPNIVKKSEIKKIAKSITENLDCYIGEDEILNLVLLSYIDYKIIYSKTKLNSNYFFAQIMEKYYPEGASIYEEKFLTDVKNYLRNDYGLNVDDYSDRYITSRISGVSTLVARGVWKYNASNSLSEEVLQQIEEFIKSYPISSIPIRSIFDTFENVLLECGIENRYAFQGALRNTKIDVNYKITKDYIYTDDNQNIVNYIEDFIKNSNELVTKEVLEQKFPGFQIGVMQRVIATTSIVNMNGYYASMDNFDISQEDIENLKNEINNVVEDEQSHNSKNIFYRFKNKFNGLFNRIGITHYLQFYYIVNKLFEDDFEFLRPFIAKKGVEIQDKETQVIDSLVEKKYCSLLELKELCKKIGFFMESTMDFVIRNNDTIMFSDEKTIETLDYFGLNDKDFENIDEKLDIYMYNREYRKLEEVSFGEELEDKYRLNKWSKYSIISIFSTKYKIYRTSNKRASAELYLITEDCDTSKIQDVNENATFEWEELSDMLDVEDLE